MGFFDTLRHVLGGQSPAEKEADPALARAWGLESNEDGQSEEASAYDRAQWVRRLKRILEELPASRAQWDELMSDARALGFDAAWLKHAQHEEFLLLVRRAVSDRKFTEEEHRKLDLARDLIGLPEEQAEKELHSIVAEAEKFFGRKIEES